MSKHSTKVSLNDCENCDDLRRKYSILEGELELLKHKYNFEVQRAQLEIEEWKKMYCELQTVVDGSYSRSHFIESDIPPPQELTIDNFGTYYMDMLIKYPFLEFIMQFCLSHHHNRKINASDTSEEWLMSSDFYKSYLLDTILKSRNSKAVLRTQLFLGVYFYLVKVSEPAWRILERLRILPSRQYVQDYLESQPLVQISQDNVLVFCFDNCDILMHMTHRRESHESWMFHMVTRLVFEIPRCLAIPAISLWKEYNKASGVAFGNWLRMSDKDTLSVANLTTNTIVDATELGGLRFALEKGSNPIVRSKMLILPPEINKSTAKYEDVGETLRNFFNAHIRGTKRTFALVSGDQQVFTLIWFLRIKFPSEFQWVVPIPGEWHWEWHILKGIYRLWGHYLLKPLADVLGYKNLDLDCKVFHYGEDFLEVVSISLCKWYKVLQLKWPTHTPAQILHQIKPFSHAYELLYFFIWYVCPYWYTRAVLKVGNAAALTNMWRYWLHLFIATGKWKYACLSIRFLWILDNINIDLKAVFDEFRTFSKSGAEGTGVAYDNMIEMVNLYIKTMNSLHPSEARLELTANSLNYTLPMQESVRNLVNHHSTHHRKYVGGTEQDVTTLCGYFDKCLGNVVSKARKRVDWDRDIWYSEGSNESGRIQECSHFAEEGFDKVSQWFVNNQQFLISCKGKIKEMDLYTEDDDESDEDKEEERTLDDFNSDN